jgi:signal transduction histidine kinase
MKIGKKLLLSNIAITVSAMIILTVIITRIVNGYIKDNINEDIVAANKSISEMLSLGKAPDYLEDYMTNQKLPTVSIIFDAKSHEFLGSTEGVTKGTLTEKELTSLLAQKQGEIKNLELWGKECVLYSRAVTYQNKEFVIATLIFNDDVGKISQKIIIALIVAIVAISVLIVLTSRFSEKMITKPIKTLVETTENFAVKKFDDKAVINTKDEFKTLATAINAMADSLKQQDVEQKQFYENISHELKTPITVISGYAQGIKSGIVENRDKSLDVITEECDRLKKQLENIIYLSKLDTVKESFQFERSNINSIISNALNQLDSLIIIHEIDIDFNPSNAIYISADEEKLTRAFINILSNCIKYTKDIISITAKQNEDSIEVTITDNGNGFSDVLLNSPFNRSMVGDKEGSGIGLSIVKKIIDGHGSGIALSNKKQGGACYYLKFSRDK